METLESLIARWNELKQSEPKMRIRDAAMHLGTSEAQLVATRIGEGVVRLRPDYAEMLPRMQKLGRVMVLTRNDDCVHERKGVWQNVSVSPAHALAVGPDIDLRLFPSVWKFAFAVEEAGGSGVRKSFQFFDECGIAVHKIYAEAETDADEWNMIIHDFAMVEQEALLQTRTAPAPQQDLPDAEIDAEGLRRDWSELKDTHDFFPMLKRHRVGRLQALRLVGSEWAVPVSAAASRKLLELASEREVPIMVFVGNSAAIQIHTGPVKRIVPTGPWINVLDPDFNLHLRETAITTSWVVYKPTEDGMVTSVEVFDAQGAMIVQFFGKRKPGIPELEEWRSIVADLRNELPVSEEAHV